ncbi:helix-turn-helix transcriptional regulator [Seohaeicola zhoushanensis]|uniref:Uncharacterized protein n=1 Tax=Seohaeicola zhoushanensis TaxID=1569283 RepID=A0A8J3GTV4_9RHOB|nr:hypothetical protein [Seohaeicola zhoushanensis]GHF33106.1 hypothetical protein GCM10017056_00630 [Seohaeicola zhoushanensis]
MTFVTADEVARMTGFESGEAFLRARDRLEKRERFPAPMPTCLRPLKWRRDAIAAWVEEHGIFGTRAVSGPNVVLFEMARQA